MIDKKTLEKPRTPCALTEFVNSYIREAKNNEVERHAAYLKKGSYKEFIDELVPLSIFCKSYYDASDRVEVSLIVGHQPYDAIVKKEGTIVEKIEITTPHNGTKSAEEFRELVTTGFSGGDSYDPGEDLDNLKPFILATCLKKAKKNYPNCLLVIAIDYLSPFDEHQSLYEEKISSICEEIKKITFKAKKVFLLEARQHRLHELIN